MCVCVSVICVYYVYACVQVCVCNYSMLSVCELMCVFASICDCNMSVSVCVCITYSVRESVFASL